MSFQYTYICGPPRLPFSKDALGLSLHLASGVHFLPCRDQGISSGGPPCSISQPPLLSQEKQRPRHSLSRESLPRFSFALWLSLFCFMSQARSPSKRLPPLAPPWQSPPLAFFRQRGQRPLCLLTLLLRLPKAPSPEKLPSREPRRSPSKSTCLLSRIAPSFTPRRRCPKASSPTQTTASKTLSCMSPPAPPTKLPVLPSSLSDSAAAATIRTFSLCASIRKSGFRTMIPSPTPFTPWRVQIRSGTARSLPALLPLPSNTTSPNSSASAANSTPGCAAFSPS